MIPFGKQTEKHPVYSMPVQVRGETVKIWLFLKKTKRFCFVNPEIELS